MIKLLNILREVILLESEKLAKQYVKDGKLSNEDLEKLTAIDPSPTRKFVGWMAKQWISKTVTDIDDLRNTIEEYNVFLNKGKAKTKDINAFRSFADLKKEVNTINQSGEGISVKDLESDADNIINNSDLLVMSPHTPEASRKLGLSYFSFRDCKGGGKDSAWCTTYKTPDHFNDYYHSHNVTFYYVRVKSPQMIEQLKQAFPEKYKAMEVVALAVLDNGMIDGYDGLDEKLSKKEINTFINIAGISKILVPRRSPEERQKNYLIATQKKIQQHIKDGGKGDLDLSNTPIQSLPDGLEVGGDLDLSNTPIQSLPDGLEVGGDLNLNNCKNLKSLPDGLEVGGDLDLEGTPIQSLPNGLKVGGYLSLSNTPIQSLPPGLKVEGDLFLGGTPIQSLPPGLEVRGGLYLKNTPIQSLPPDLKVGGYLNLKNTPISKKYTEDEIRKMIPGVKSQILL